VFLAEDLPGTGVHDGSKRYVAVKLLHKESKAGHAGVICRRENLLREAKFLAALQGKPNIVELRGLYEDDQFAYVTMEVCDSGDIQGLIDRSACPMCEAFVACLARQMCRAILGVHEENICYCDVKVSLPFCIRNLHYHFLMNSQK
jgi:serine/threonine protein kinase